MSSPISSPMSSPMSTPLPEPDATAAASADGVADASRDTELRIEGDTHAKQGRWDEAIRAYKQAAEFAPVDSALLNALAKAYLGAGDPGAAEDAYKQSVALSPDDGTACFELGSFYEEQRRTAEAVQAYETGLSRSPRSDGAIVTRRKLERLTPERAAVRKAIRGVRGERISLLSLAGVFLVMQTVPSDLAISATFAALAVLTWRVKAPAIIVAYATLIAWVGVHYGTWLLNGAPIWAAANILLWLGMAGFMLRKYLAYRRAKPAEMLRSGSWPADVDSPGDETAFADRLAVIGAAMGAAVLVLGPVVLCGGSVMVAATNSPQLMDVVSWGTSILEGVGAIALGLGLAAMLSGTTRRRLATAAAAAGGLIVLGNAALVVFYAVYTALS